MAAIRLAAISLDTTDPSGLAGFYRDLLGVTVMFESEAFVALEGAGVLLTTQLVPDHRPPDWPESGTPKQMHLELAVDDLEAAEARALPRCPQGGRAAGPRPVACAARPRGPSLLHHHPDPRD